MCMLIAIPVAVLVAIYMSEYARSGVATFLRLVLDVLNGVPAIVVGIFVFGLLVVGHGQSAVYGAFALAILMLPMVARATQEVLDIVPRSQREASLALGVTKWRTTWNIILPSAIGGILTGVVIAVARVAGETAPLLFTSSIAANADLVRRLERAADPAGRDLRVLRVARPERAGDGLGGRARADRVRARDEHPREGLRRPEAPPARRQLIRRASRVRSDELATGGTAPSAGRWRASALVERIGPHVQTPQQSADAWSAFDGCGVNAG